MVLMQGTVVIAILVGGKSLWGPFGVQLMDAFLFFGVRHFRVGSRRKIGSFLTGAHQIGRAS